MPHVPDEKATSQVITAALSEPWACHEAKLLQIAGLLETRANGGVVSEQTILQTMAVASQASFRSQLRHDLGRDDDDGPLVVDGVYVTQLYGTLGPRMNLMMRFSGGTSTQNFANEILRAAEREDVTSILVEDDSPGGLVPGTHEAALAIDTARRKGKRVRIVGRSMMASAAYWIASAGTVVSAEPSTEVGSVGVYMIYQNVEKAAEKAGVKYEVFRAGDLKAAGNPYESLTKERRAAMQERIDAPYRMFIAAVARFRGVEQAEVLDRFGQGSVFLAEEASERGLIDDVVTIDEAFAEERKIAKGTMQVVSAGGRFGTDRGGVGRAVQDRPQPEAEQPPVGETQGRPQPAGEVEESMSAKLKAMLFGMGLIEAADASDEVCSVALNAWFRGRGRDQPKGEEEILKALQGGDTLVATQEQTAEPIADNVRRAREQELAEAREEAGREAVARADQIRASVARLQASGVQIADDQVTAAINNRSLSASAAVGHLVQQFASSPPTSQDRGVTRITPTGSEPDAFVAGAVDALRLRCGTVQPGAQGLSPHARGLARASMEEIYRRDLSNRNIEHRHLDREAAASVWLSQGGQMFFSGDPLASEQSIASPGDYPNLLSGWGRKILDDAIMLGATTYGRWTARHPSVNDLHAHLVMGKGPLGLLEDIGDDEKAPQDQLAEEALAWFKAQRKSKKVPLTAVMVAHDDLGAFVEQFAALRTSQDLTIEDMCVRLLVANGNLLDGQALFAAAHANIVAQGAGAVPQAAQATLMRLLLQRQTVIGGRHVANLTPDLVLVPPALEDAAKQTYLPLVQFGEQKVPITDATISTNRGTVRDVITIPTLETIGGALGLQMWYVFANPALAPVVKVVFMRGWENGRTDTWFDPDRQTRYWRLETRVAVFANHFRGGARNFGA